MITEIKIQPIRSGFKLPEKASEGSAAYDVFSPALFPLEYGQNNIVPLGFRVEMPRNVALDVRSRSSYSCKGIPAYDINGNLVRLKGHIELGLIDSDYRGEIGAIITIDDERVLHLPYCLAMHEKVAQMKFCFVPDIKLSITHDDLSNTVRGSKGFGDMDEDNAMVGDNHNFE